MNKRIVGSSCAAALLCMTVAAAGQVNTQTPTQSPVQSNQQGAPAPSAPAVSRTQTDQQMTIVGCVAREGSSENEFVLNNAAMSSGAPPASGVAGSTSAGRVPGATGTTGAAAGTTMNYSLTGSKESELSQYLGQRVEIVAKMSTDASASGARAGDPSDRAGDPAVRDRAGDPSVTPRDAAGTTGASTRPGTASTAASAKPQRVEIVSYRAVGGSCQ